jgi:AraC family transcriptional regulator
MENLDAARPPAKHALIPPGAARPGPGLAPWRLRSVLSCIDARFNENVCVRELAATIHMSPFHFSRMFKAATGRAPHAYIIEVRMARAKQLLSETSLALVEVAACVGYQTQAHFTGVFHKHVGATPREFRLGTRTS